jgi:SagB-type dehydrogenase family enzyme
MASRDAEAARAYHEATKHSEERLYQNARELDWDNQPAPFKIYTSLEPIPLPREWPPLEVPALEAIAGPVGEAPEERIPDLLTLSRVLYFAAGITKRKRYPGGETYFRAYPNTGALYHIDLYLVCGELSDLSAGVYHFGPHDFALRRLREGDHRATLVEASGHEPAVARAPAIIVTASTYWRNAWKYQARAYRHCFWDSGTLHANLLAVAGTERLAPRVVASFADRAVERLLGLDPTKEAALTLVPLGRCADPPPPSPKAPKLRLETAPLSRSEVDYPLIREIQGASSLASGARAAAWRERVCESEASAASGRLHPLEPLADDALPSESLESVIQRRGSTRRFEREASITSEELATILERAGSELPADFVPESGSLVDLYLIVHAVEGIPPGAYYYRREERVLELLREGNFRRAAGRLGLFQTLPASAAVNVYVLADLDAVLGALGGRGYRAAQLEGGIRGGRMYLAAYAQRFGATGLTFLDDEVTDFFSPHAEGKSVMFLVALGRAARRRR